MFAALLLVLSAPVQPPVPKPVHPEEITSAEPSFSLAKTEVFLSRVGGRGEVVLKSRTTGWVLIGFNEKRGLDGAWLVMARVDNRGAVVIEEHRATPPRHAPLSQTEVAPHVRNVSGGEHRGVTTVRFSLPLSKREGAPFDIAGQRVELIVAQSESDDFYHHSRAREHRFGRLTWAAPATRR